MRSPIHPPSSSGRSGAGFTLIEIMVVMAVLSILVLVSMLTFRAFYPRMQLRTTTSEASQIIQKARLEAIKRGVDTVVVADELDLALIAFADVDGQAAPPADQYLFTPGPDSATKQDDYEIGRVDFPQTSGSGIHFGSAGDPPGGPYVVVDGLTNIPSNLGATPVLVFTSDGTVEDLGAFRIADQFDNHFEIRLTSVAGSLEILKFIKAADAPGNIPGYYREGNRSETAVSENIWVWY